MASQLLNSVRNLLGIPNPEAKAALLHLNEKEVELVFQALQYGMSPRIDRACKVIWDDTAIVLQEKCTDYLSTAPKQYVYKDRNKYNLIKMDMILVKYLRVLGEVCKNEKLPDPKKAEDGLVDLAPNSFRSRIVPVTLLNNQTTWSNVLDAVTFTVPIEAHSLGTQVKLEYAAFAKGSPVVIFPKRKVAPPKSIDF